MKLWVTQEESAMGNGQKAGPWEQEKSQRFLSRVAR